MARQQIFNRNQSFVAVRHIRLSSDSVVEPGDPVDGLRQFHLRDLHRRRRIGAVGDPWTEEMLNNQDPLFRPELDAVSHPGPDQGVPGSINPFMHQDTDGNWVLGTGQVFDSLGAALEAWHNTTTTENTGDDPDASGDQTKDTSDQTDQGSEAKEGEGAETKAPAEGESAETKAPAEGESTETEAPKDAPADEAKAPVEKPKPVKVGSQWTIEGVEGKFTSAKKALEAWSLEH